MIKYSNTNFYRAFRSPISNGEHQNIYIDGTRQPTHMPLEAHQIIDSWFENRFSIKARSSTIFVGTKRESVSKYAQYSSCVVKRISFPKDSKFIYSLSICDLFDEIDDLQHIDGELTKESIHQFLENAEYQITSQPDSIPSDFLGEIMVYCHNFLLQDV